MKITKVNNDNQIIIRLEGWLDVETTVELAKYMSELEATKDLVFDFEKLEYISSSGVREVIASYKRQKEEGGVFKVINVNPEVMDVFSMTGLDKKLNIIAK